MSDTQLPIEQPRGEHPRTERRGIHPEHMNYLYARLNRAEIARADLARLQAAREAALRGDASGITADLQRRHEEDTRYLEQQRQYIEQHPLGSLEGDALYLKLKADIQRGENVLAKVGKDEDSRAYILEKINQDKSTQATTGRGKIMSSVSVTQRELQQIQHLQQILPQAGK